MMASAQQGWRKPAIASVSYRDVVQSNNANNGQWAGGGGGGAWGQQMPQNMQSMHYYEEARYEEPRIDPRYQNLRGQDMGSRDDFSSWLEQCIFARGPTVRLNCSNSQLGDRDLSEALHYFDDFLMNNDGPNRELDIDLSKNDITDDGIAYDLAPFLAKWPRCRRLKLYMTGIGDRALSSLCPWAAGGYAHELHLSDLRGTLTTGGVSRFLEEICWEGRYPYQTRDGGFSALWLRLENNKIPATEELVDKGCSQGLRLRVINKAGLGQIRPGAAGEWQETASVHLVLFHEQGLNTWRRDDYADDRGYGRHEDEYWSKGRPARSWDKGGKSDWGKGEARQGKGDWGKGKRQDYQSRGWEDSYEQWPDSGNYQSSSQWHWDTPSKGRDDRYSRGKVQKESWGSGPFQLPGSHSSKLNYAELGLRDEDLVGKDFKSLSSGKAIAELGNIQELDLSRNAFAGVGLHALVDFCLKLKSLQVIKLYKCKIADVGATSLAELCWRCPRLDQLHLSHNRLTSRGVEKIIKAACGSRDEATAGSSNPLWLRLEYNQVENAKELFDTWKQGELSVCHVPKGCTTSYCKHQKQVHVPFFLSQALEDGTCPPCPSGTGASEWKSKAKSYGEDEEGGTSSASKPAKGKKWVLKETVKTEEPASAPAPAPVVKEEPVVAAAEAAPADAAGDGGERPAAPQETSSGEKSRRRTRGRRQDGEEESTAFDDDQEFSGGED